MVPFARLRTRPSHDSFESKVSTLSMSLFTALEFSMHVFLLVLYMTQEQDRQILSYTTESNNLTEKKYMMQCVEVQKQLFLRLPVRKHGILRSSSFSLFLKPNQW